jgi:hypothetical protein
MPQIARQALPFPLAFSTVPCAKAPNRLDFAVPRDHSPAQSSYRRVRFRILKTFSPA